MSQQIAQAGTGVYRCTTTGQTKFVKAGDPLPDSPTEWRRYAIDNTDDKGLLTIKLAPNGGPMAHALMADFIPEAGYAFNIEQVRGMGPQDGLYVVQSMDDTDENGFDCEIRAVRAGDLDHSKSFYLAQYLYC